MFDIANPAVLEDQIR
jgi:hypothetical protein